MQSQFPKDVLPKDVRRVAMWSGPRNISTALMRSWGSRADTLVCDEPFYAHYLQQTGYSYHPGYEQILENHETDWQRVVDWLLGPLPDGKQIFYQKQMAQHLLPHMEVDWTDGLTNVFLIRDPREMLLSLTKFFPNATAAETGLPQQVKLFQRVQERTGAVPPVIDAKDVLLDPAGVLTRLCNRIAIPYDEQMLKWEPGLHDTDGVWAEHWYANTAASTCFAEYRPRTGQLPEQKQGVLDECQQLYDALACHKI